MFRRSQENVQVTLADKMLYINDQTKKAIDSSRAKLVGDIIYPNVDESKFEGLYSKVGSRPNIGIRKYVCALILKRMYVLSDEVLIEFLRCGALNFQYALHTTQDEKQPLSENSLRRFRRKVEDFNQKHGCDLIKEEFVRISKMLAIDMGLLKADPNSGDGDADPIIVRMDSMEIEAHAKSMTRIEILYMTNVIVIRYLLKKDYADVIPEELSHYLEDGDHNKTMYYRVKDDKKAGVQDERVADAIKEMILLKDSMCTFFTQKMLETIDEYKVLERVLGEQTRITENGERVPKDKGEISASSVQNPFDTTVTYRYKRGHHHGSVLNVAEVCDNDGKGIIIDAQVEPNTTADNHMAEEYISGLPQDTGKQILVADGAYNGENVEKKAAEKNVELKTTSLTGSVPDETIADFVMNDDSTEVITCPMGKQPISCKYNANSEMVTATMPNNCCASCPCINICKAKVNNKKSKSTVRVSGKMVKRATQGKELTTDKAKKLAACRNGSEGIMSVMRRKYNVDKIPVFGLERSKLWIWTTLIAYNVVKFKKYVEKNQISA